MTLKQEIQQLSKEIEKKERVIQELVSDKAGGTGPGRITNSSNGFKAVEDMKVKRLEAELKILKKEKDEFFASRFDKKNAELVKDLSNQNAKIRLKMEQLEQNMKRDSL